MNTRLLIGGRLVAGEGAADVVLDAATGAQVASVQAASVEQVQAAVAAAEKAFDAWSRTAPKDRALALTRGEEAAAVLHVRASVHVARLESFQGQSDRAGIPARSLARRRGRL